MTATPDFDPFDQLLLDTLGRIDRYGYTMMMIGTGQCSVPGCDCVAMAHPYAYSIGMHRLDQPEMVMFGVPNGSVNKLSDFVYNAAAAGSPLAAGRQHRHWVDDRLAICLDPVPASWVGRDRDRVGTWFSVHGRFAGPPEFVQVCWSFEQGVMPWDDDSCPECNRLQPLLADHPLRYPSPPPRHRRTGYARPRR